MLFIKKYKRKMPTDIDEKPLAIFIKWKAFKQKLAIKLQEKFESLSAQTKKYALIMFCILFGGSSIAIIINTLTNKVSAVKVAKISKPEYANENGQSILQPDSIITKKEYDRVLQFENYMLGLNSDSLGRKKFDCIIKSRPQLMDSIVLFKKMYFSQNKK